jgi:hypothetical protein
VSGAEASVSEQQKKKKKRVRKASSPKGNIKTSMCKRERINQTDENEQKFKRSNANCNQDRSVLVCKKQGENHEWAAAADDGDGRAAQLTWYDRKMHADCMTLFFDR